MKEEYIIPQCKGVKGMRDEDKKKYIDSLYGYEVEDIDDMWTDEA